MTYEEFKTGLYIKHHFAYSRSVSFIKFSQIHYNDSNTMEDLIILKVDAEKVLNKVRNPNMREALCLIAQGFLYWEIAEMLKLTERTIERYVERIKKICRFLGSERTLLE